MLPRARLSLLFALLLPLGIGADTRAFRDLSPAEQVEVMRSEARVALVIGNGAYDGAAALRNPPADARAVAEALRQVGFDVTYEQDLGNIAMREALAAFGRQLEAGGVGLFYYAGHGIQYEGTNYLVPVDARLARPDDLEIFGVPAVAVLTKMENAGNRVNIVILDACRNDPFSRGSGGLSMMEAKGTFLAYAAGSGKVATDQGVYARSLTRHLRTAGARIEDVFKHVGADVEEATAGAQSPWVGSNLRGDFFFVLPEKGWEPPPSPVAPVQATSTVQDDGYARKLAELQSAQAAADAAAAAKAAAEERARREAEDVAARLAAAERARADAAAALAAERRVKLDAEASEVRARATAAWNKTKPLLEGSEAKVAAQVFVDSYGRASVTVTDETGTYTEPVDIPEVTEALRYLGVPKGIDWVRIPGGSFQMGSNDGDLGEKPVHAVHVGSFEMSRSEVTVAQYRACVDAGECTEPGTGGYMDACNWGKSGRDDHPINCVDWHQASAFARWAGGRLPSEAEWEYAARGGESYIYAGSNTAGDVAWYEGNSGDRTHEVCGKRHNGYGLCDMSGNVWEWVEDWYHDSYAGAPSDGSAWTTGGGSYRVYRGGTWTYSAARVRVADRDRNHPTN